MKKGFISIIIFLIILTGIFAYTTYIIYKSRQLEINPNKNASSETRKVETVENKSGQISPTLSAFSLPNIDTTGWTQYKEKYGCFTFKSPPGFIAQHAESTSCENPPEVYKREGATLIRIYYDRIGSAETGVSLVITVPKIIDDIKASNDGITKQALNTLESQNVGYTKRSDQFFDDSKTAYTITEESIVNINNKKARIVRHTNSDKAPLGYTKWCPCTSEVGYIDVGQGKLLIFTANWPNKDQNLGDQLHTILSTIEMAN